MAEKFNGTFDELKQRIERHEIVGDWDDDGNKHSFRSNDGGVLNWWQSTGTLQIQGRPEASRRLRAAVLNEDRSGLLVVPAARVSENIFIVHGHDTEARDQLELALHRLGLEPFILMNTSGGGRTIIEALEGQIGRDYSSDFGIVLLTPDDVGYAKRDGVERAEPRARQNVILETGMLLASLTRRRMAIVIKGHLEVPSDLQGIIHFGYNDHIKEIIPKLCQRLQEAGFRIDPNKVAAAAQ